mmetsp:Transcript_26150/g.39429  ORF Transcript_26150/g.39429 Transcript_26150/m.39429 type:complete len:271 (+) Transcript_26150:134-946(+)
MKHFIFGYGSLICPQSRSVTAPTLKSIAEPVIINHIERIWSARVLKGNSLVLDKNREHIRGWTPMGIRKRQGASCNGVLIHVDDEELERFDIREEGYKRHRIDLIDVYPHCESAGCNSVTDDLVLNAVRCPECNIVFEKAHKKRSANDVDESDIAVWVYIQNEESKPNPSFPITQSYVDIIMRGCLTVSKEFARKFLQTTHGWWNDGELDGIRRNTNDEGARQHHTWVDDRQSPMYVRADSDFSIEHGDAIDRLIEEHHPHALEKRVISM